MGHFIEIAIQVPKNTKIRGKMCNFFRFLVCFQYLQARWKLQSAITYLPKQGSSADRNHYKSLQIYKNRDKSL